MPTTTWSARSYSAALTPLFGATPYPLTLISSHPHACNLATPSGALIALICPRYGNGPFHVMGSATQLPHISSSTSLYYQPGVIALGRLTLQLTGAAHWQPRLPVLRKNFVNALSSLHEFHGPLETALHQGSAAQVARAQQGIGALEMGMRDENYAEVMRGVMALAGLGPGLTPAGDDFLVGMMAALHATGQIAPSERQPPLAQLIATTAAAQTTLLSATWLQHAGTGHFSQRWHELILALNRELPAQIQQAVVQLKATGATSGVDGLFGFITALSWIVRYG